MEGIEIAIGRVGARHDIALLRVRGYIDTQTCGQMLAQITSVLKEGYLHLIVDMSQVNYVSSAGWGVFVGEIKGIRESGGDLKIVQMMPEVYDVFEMLEFNRILDSYDSIEEAIDDFDLSIGLDITKSISRTFRPDNGGTLGAIIAPPKPSSRSRDSEQSRSRMRASFSKPKIDEKVMPLTEKIKALIIDNPTQGAVQLKKKLNSERFGFTKVGLIKVYQILRKLNLNTKEKRYRFYRSR